MSASQTPRPASSCAPYPEGSLGCGGAPAAPLNQSVPGYVFAAQLEPLFDAVFREVGPGSFEEALRENRQATLLEPDQQPAAWDPEPVAGQASVPKIDGDSASEPPRRVVRYCRPLQLPAWVRLAGQMSDTCECTETWTAFGLGGGSGFLVCIETHIAGAPLSDCFVLQTRYKAISLSGESTQLDAEFELQWHRSSMFQSRAETAVLSECRRFFESVFLPLVASTPMSAAPPSPVNPDAEPQHFQISRTSTNLVPTSMASERSIESEYEIVDWRTACTFELRIEVLGASELLEPAYRLGDFSSSLMGGTAALLSKVYVELQLGTKRKCTDPAENPQGERSFGFNSERLLFVYSGETELQVSCLDKRSVQAVFRGDPLIGRGVLQLGPDLCDCFPRWADVPLLRDGKAAGSISLRYHFLKVADGGVVPSATAAAEPSPTPTSGPPTPNSMVANFNLAEEEASMGAPTGGGGSGEEAEDGFVTPPSSP